MDEAHLRPAEGPGPALPGDEYLDQQPEPQVLVLNITCSGIHCGCSNTNQSHPAAVKQQRDAADTESTPSC